MLNKNSHLVLLFFIVMLFDSIATGITSLKTTQFFISSASVHNLLFGTGFTILLSPIYIIAAPLLGYWSDQSGRRHLLIMCFAVAMFSFLLSLFGQLHKNLGITLFGCLLYGISSCCLPLIMATISDISRKVQRVRFLGAIVFTLSFVVVGNYLGTLLQVHFPQYSYVTLKVATALEGINLILICLCVPALFTPHQYGKKQMQFFGFAQNLVRVMMVKGIRKQLFWLIGFCFSWGLYSQVIYMLLTRFHHFSKLQTSNFQLYNFGILALAFFITLTPFGKYIAKNSIRVLRLNSFIATCCLLYICIHHMSITSFFLIAIPLNLCFGLMLICIWQGLAQASSDRHYGLVMGLQGSSWAFAWSLSNIISSAFTSFASSTYADTQRYFLIIVIIMTVITISIRQHKKLLSA